jgi:high-affinity iron transporter
MRLGKTNIFLQKKKMIAWSPAFAGMTILFVAMFSTFASAMEPWQAGETIRRNTAKIERYVFLPDSEANRAKLDSLVEEARSAFDDVLNQPFASPPIGTDFDNLKRALADRSPVAVARFRNRIWTGIIAGAYKQLMGSLERGEFVEAKRWLSIREYARASRDTAAGEAIDAAIAGKMGQGRAVEIIQGELLRVYAGEMRRALGLAEKAADKKYFSQLAGYVNRAHGLSLLLSSNMAMRMGSDKQTVIAEHFVRLVSIEKSLGRAAKIDDIIPPLHSLNVALLGYSPVVLSREDRERHARLLSRFFGLVYIEYKDGVRDGKVVIPVEYHEARLFRDRAQMLLGDLQGELMNASPESFEKLSANLKEMHQIIEAKGSKERIKELSNESEAITNKVFDIKKGEGGHKVAFQMLPAIMDEIVMLVGAGDYPGAELKRLEAYSFFDPDIEQRLLPRAPTLSLKLESLFWEGSVARPGLGRLIEQKASKAKTKKTTAETKELLRQAKEILNAKLGSTGAFMQSFAIIMREGLEAIIVIAALIGTLRALGTTGYPVYIWGGVILALIASFALWYAAGRLITVSTANRELLEGATALLAAAVLIYVTHWIFHKTYVTDWMSFIKEKVEDTASSGRLMTLGVLSFFVVFREGFETVLFYEALMIDASPTPVLGGFATGVLGTGLIAVALIHYGLRLPLGLFFKITGFLLMALTIIFVGVGIRGLQTAGLVSATPVAGFPESPFLQLYFGIFPVAEPLIAQAAVITLFIVGWLWMRHSLKNKNAANKAQSA